MAQIWLVLILTAISGWSFGQTQVNKSVKKTNLAKTEPVFSGEVSLSQSETLVDQKNGSRKSTRGVVMAIKTKISSQWSVTTKLSAEDDLRNTESPKNGFGDTVFLIGKTPGKLNPWLMGNPGFSTVLPTSKYSRNYQQFKTSIGANYNFALTESVVGKKASVSLNVGASRLFHDYETDKAGTLLNQYGMREILSLAYQVAPVTFSFEFIHRHAWNYENSVSQSFEHSETMRVAITPTWAISLGHTNSGTWLTPDGQDSNLKLINENDSLFYVGTSLSF